MKGKSMRLREIQDVLGQRPFIPFRVYVSDGAAYDVRHPEMCMPGRRSVIVGLPEPEVLEPVYDRHVIIDLDHISRLEPIGAKPAKKSGIGKKSS